MGIFSRREPPDDQQVPDWCRELWVELRSVRSGPRCAATPLNEASLLGLLNSQELVATMGVRNAFARRHQHFTSVLALVSAIDTLRYTRYLRALHGLPTLAEEQGR